MKPSESQSSPKATEIPAATPLPHGQETRGGPGGPEAVPGTKPKNVRVLVAEDNLMNQRVTQRQLQQLGWVVDVVANGRAAVEALTRIPYDLVLMDCQMPEMDGDEATVEIRRREAGRKHTPIIALTGHALESERQKCLAAGMDDCVSKPVKPDELRRVVAHWLMEGGRRQAEGRQGDRPAETAGTESRAESSPVDLETLRETTDGTEEDLREVVDLYLRQARELLAQLDAALQKGDAVEIKRAAHKCAGSSALCGATHIVPPLRELERMGAEGCLDGAPQIALQAAREFERIEAFLRARLQRDSSAGG